MIAVSDVLVVLGIVVAAWALLVAVVLMVGRRAARIRERRHAARRRLERRSGRDRRGGDRRGLRVDRRIGEPDARADPVERRRGGERRSGRERRSGLDRRAAPAV